MKTFLKSIFLIVLLCSCSKPQVKTMPEYSGVDPAFRPLVNEYIYLARQKGIVFDKTITIGFKNINYMGAVGVCNFGSWFREIDVDRDYWNRTSSLTHLALLFHELSHGYCSRYHDYGENKMYPESVSERIKQHLNWIVSTNAIPGHYNDGCPLSLMYPEVVDTDCVTSHYLDYVDEMFERCVHY